MYKWEADKDTAIANSKDGEDTSTENKSSEIIKKNSGQNNNKWIEKTDKDTAIEKGIDKTECYFYRKHVEETSEVMEDMVERQDVDQLSFVAASPLCRACTRSEWVSVCDVRQCRCFALGLRSELACSRIF